MGGYWDEAVDWMEEALRGPVAHFYMDANGIAHRLVPGTGGLTEQTYDLLELRLEEYYDVRG